MFFVKKKIDPVNHVIIFPIKPNFKVIKNEKTLFNSLFSDIERDQLIQLYSEKNNAKPFNGKSIRLDHIKNFDNSTIIEISEIEFFDFLSTTMIYNQKDSFIDYCDKHNKKKEKTLIEKICHVVDRIKDDPSFEEIIGVNELSNILAVSILIEDKNGEVGLLHRSKNVAVSSGIFSVTATGSLDEQDYDKENPFISCAMRELEEELNIHPDTIVLDEIVMSKHKLQPIALFQLKLEQSWKELVPTIKAARDFNQETQEIYSVPISALSQFLYAETFTDAAAYQIFTKLNRNLEEPRSDFDKSVFLI